MESSASSCSSSDASFEFSLDFEISRVLVESLSTFSSCSGCASFSHTSSLASAETSSVASSRSFVALGGSDSSAVAGFQGSQSECVLSLNKFCNDFLSAFSIFLSLSALFYGLSSGLSPPKRISSADSAVKSSASSGCSSDTSFVVTSNFAISGFLVKLLRAFSCCSSCASSSEATSSASDGSSSVATS